MDLARATTPPALERWAINHPRPAKRKPRPRTVPIYVFKTREERELEKIRRSLHDGPLSPSSDAYRIRSCNEKELQLKDGMMDLLEADNAAMEELLAEGDQLLAKGNLDAFANLIEQHNGKGGKGGSALLRYLSQGEGGVTGIKKQKNASASHTSRSRRRPPSNFDSPRSASSENSMYRQGSTTSIGSGQSSDGGFSHAPALRFRSSMPGFVAEDEKKDDEKTPEADEKTSLPAGSIPSIKATKLGGTPRGVTVVAPANFDAQVAQKKQPTSILANLQAKTELRKKQAASKVNYADLLKGQEVLEQARQASDDQYKEMLSNYQQSQENSQKALDLIISAVPDPPHTGLSESTMSRYSATKPRKSPRNFALRGLGGLAPNDEMDDLSARMTASVGDHSVGEGSFFL
eukprot:TRINITY_DN2876_c0_g1_i1.p1 TRINITY_DN2876_c0_g1~~TRINITY_DN2876_c0_g1_i1.p1  ORF type:complete len:405 (+),score=53.98 TRINITY_DN2876_c0_g1_i1:62-1276(+)